ALNQLIAKVRDINPDAKLYHLTGSPCPNEFSEMIGCLKSATNNSFEFLDTKKTLSNGLDIFVEVSQLTTRVRHLPKDYKVTNKNVIIECDELFDDIRSTGASWAQQCALTIPHKLQYLKKLLKKPEPILIFTHYVTEIIEQIVDFLNQEGYGHEYVIHTGTEKDGVHHFLSNPRKRILIGSIGAMGCGVDGIQDKCARIVYLGYPWTAEEKKQADGRCDRVGQQKDVTIYNLIAESTQEVEGDTKTISFDRFLLRKHEQKRTLSDLCVDGIIPGEGNDFSNDALNASTQEWKEMIEEGEGVTRIQVEEIFIPDTSNINPFVPKARYSDISQEHARCRSSYSDTNYERYQLNPDSWKQYHQLLSTTRKTWTPDPVPEIASTIRSKGTGFRVLDFGCGTELLKEELGDSFDVVGLDYVAHSPEVIACDLCEPVSGVEQGDFGVAINALMSKDWKRMISNMKALLKGNGQLFVVQPEAQIPMDELVSCLKSNGFFIIMKETLGCFNYIRCIVD
ncbi:hypothetical protein OAE26_01985, partial [Synechococcus sp. AH-551-E05]